jgi:hypothetical protein
LAAVPAEVAGFTGAERGAATVAPGSNCAVGHSGSSADALAPMAPSKAAMIQNVLERAMKGGIIMARRRNAG